MVNEPIRHLRQGSVVPEVRSVREDVREDADQLGHAARKLVELGGLVRGEGAERLYKTLAKLGKAGDSVRVIHKRLQKRE